MGLKTAIKLSKYQMKKKKGNYLGHYSFLFSCLPVPSLNCYKLIEPSFCTLFLMAKWKELHESELRSVTIPIAYQSVSLTRAEAPRGQGLSSLVYYWTFSICHNLNGFVPQILSTFFGPDSVLDARDSTVKEMDKILAFMMFILSWEDLCDQVLRMIIQQSV